MNDEDYIEILNHLRELIRQSDLSDIDEMVSMESRSINSPKTRLEVYLNMTINMLKERSGSQAINTYDRLSQSLEIEEGGEFKGVSVVLNDNESEMYQLDNYYIHDMDDFSALIIELNKVLNEIKNEPEPPTNNFNQGPSL